MRIRGKIILLLLPLSMVALLLFNFLDPIKAAFVFVSLLILIAFSLKPEVGVYGMIVALPFTFLSFRLPFRVIGEGVLPFIDLISVMALTGLVINRIFFNKDKKTLKWPVLAPFLFFILAVIVSSLLSEHVFRSLWYSLRTIFIVYWIYIFLPVNALDDLKKFKNAIWSFVAVSLGLVLLSSYTLLEQSMANEFLRFRMLNKGSQEAVISFLDRVSNNLIVMYPYATEHLLLAEFLLSALFLIIALKKLEGGRSERFLNMVVLAILAVLIGTFSRGIWLSLVLIVVIYNIDHARELLRKYFIAIPITILLLSPLAFYMYEMQSDYKVGQSSNDNRLLSLDIAWQNFLDKPVFGHGSGEFIGLVANDIRYASKFGNPPDAFGFWQKIAVENGLIGLIFFMIFSFVVASIAYGAIKKSDRRAPVVYLTAAVLSVYLFELTNVSYYTGKMWLPIGIMLAGIYLMKKNYYLSFPAGANAEGKGIHG